MNHLGTYLGPIVGTKGERPPHSIFRFKQLDFNRVH